MDVLDKVRKLLKLAESPNANEAASAAAKAQQLIDEYNLSAELLAIETNTETADEPIENFLHKGAPLDSGSQFPRWKSSLALHVAKANACRVYMCGRNLALVGRASDAEVVRYLYAYLIHEIERLCAKDGRGAGRIWRNNYRLGVVDTIKVKLQDQKKKFTENLRNSQPQNSQALIKVDQALVRLEAKSQSVDRWVTQNLRLRKSRSSHTQDLGARFLGQKAGESISLNRARGSITA